jgi:hypothetical protein
MPIGRAEDIVDRLIADAGGAVGQLQPESRKRKRTTTVASEPPVAPRLPISFEGLPPRPDLEELSTWQLQELCRKKRYVVRDGYDWLEKEELRWQLTAGEPLPVVRRRKRRRVDSSVP